MPKFAVSLSDGRKFVVEADEQPSEEDVLASLGETYKPEDYVVDTGQGVLATFGNALAQGASSIASGAASGIDELGRAAQDVPALNALPLAALSNYNKAVMDAVTGDRGTLKDLGTGIQGTVESAFPTNPNNPVAAGIGSAVGQAAGLLGTTLATGGAGLAPEAAAGLGLANAALMGAEQGGDTADDLNVTDPLKRAGMVAGFAGAELVSESLGGFGTTKFARSLLRDVPQALTDKAGSAVTRGIKTALGEAAEEPVAGELQDIVSATLSDDPNAPDPFSMEALKDRAAEFGYGLAGGAVFGGAQIARGDPSSGEVLEYRRAVAEKRKNKTVLPEEVERVNELDLKAADFLRKNGMDDAMQNAAIADHLLAQDKRVAKVAQAAQNAVANDAPETAQVLEEMLTEVDQAAKDDAEGVVLNEQERQEKELLKQAEEELEQASKPDETPPIEEAPPENQNPPVEQPPADQAPVEVAPVATEPAPAPAVEEAPPPVVEEAPPPAVEEAPPPAVEEAPPPAVEEAPPPVVEEAPPPVVEAPETQQLRDFVATVSKEGQKHWTPEVIAAANTYYTTGDSAPVDALPNKIQRSRIFALKPLPVAATGHVTFGNKPDAPKPKAPAVVEEREKVTIPKQEVSAYKGEELPENAVTKEGKRKSLTGVFNRRFQMLVDEGGTERPVFTNIPQTTITQMLAGHTVQIPPSVESVDPRILTAPLANGWRMVTGVEMPVAGGKTLVVNGVPTAKEAFAFDKTGQAKSRAAAATAAKKAKTAAKKLAPLDQLPAAPDESARLAVAREGIARMVDRRYSNYAPTARDEIVAAALAHHTGNLRIEHLVQDLHNGDNDAAAKTVSDKGMAERVRNWSPSFNSLGAAVAFEGKNFKPTEQDKATQGLVGNEAAPEKVPTQAETEDTATREDTPAPDAVRRKDELPLEERASETDINQQTEAELITAGMDPSFVLRATKEVKFFGLVKSLHKALARSLGLDPQTTRTPIPELLKRVKDEKPDLSGLSDKDRMLVANAAKLLAYRGVGDTGRRYTRSSAERMREAEILGLKSGDPKSIVTALENIANDITRSYHPHLRMVARLILNQKAAVASIKGLDFGLSGPENRTAAAIYNGVTHSISFNMENEWGDYLSVGQILVHEVGHAITIYKLDAPQTEADKKFVKEIETLRARIKDYLANVRPDLYEMHQFNYALSDNAEFVTGVLSDPMFVDMLSQLPANLTAGEKVTPNSNVFVRFIRKVWANLLGRPVQSGSTLEKAMDAVFNLASTPWTTPTFENLLEWYGRDTGAHAALIPKAFRSTAGKNRYSETKVPWLRLTDANYTAGGQLFGGGRKSDFIAGKHNDFAAQKASASAQERVINRDIRSAATKEYGKAIPWDTIATALGNNENRIDPAFREQVKQARTATVRAAMGAYTSARATANANPDPAQAALLKSQAATAYLAAVKAADAQMEADLTAAGQAYVARVRQEQQTALNNLSPATRAAVVEARDKITALQEELIQSGFLSGKLIPVVDASKGIYLHRSYQVFDDPDWQNWVKGTSAEATRIRNNAQNLIRSQLHATAALQAMRNNPALTKAQALASTSVDDEEVKKELDALLHVAPDDVVGAIQGTMGGKPSSIIKKRGDIHPAIQELWGVYKDPLINASKTYGMISAYMAGQRMIRDIISDGLAKNYIFTKVAGSPPGITELVTDTAENKRRYPALFQKKANGELGDPYYGSPLLRDAIRDLGGKQEHHGTIYNTFKALTGYSMAAKTVYSLQATTRDLLSNVIIMAVNGHIPGSVKWSHIKDSLSVNARETGFDKVLEFLLSPVRGRNAPPLLDHKKLDTYIQRLVELRVLSDTVYNGTVAELLNEQKKVFRMRGEEVNKVMAALHNGIVKTHDFFSTYRALSDNLPKVVAFENELSRLKKFHPTMTPEQLELRAAEKVRMTTPTYSETSDAVKWLRSQPFISPFITFSAEVVRITFNTYKLAVQEMKSSSKGEQALGFSRATMMSLMLTALPGLIGAAARALRDPEDDEPLQTDKIASALPRFVGDWQKQNQLLWLGRTGNTHDYLDIGYLLPYDLISGPLNSAYTELFTDPDNTTVRDKLENALSEVVTRLSKPFKDQILFGALMDVRRNQRTADSDQQLYNPDLNTFAEKAAASIAHIFTQSLEPGIVRTGRLMLKGTSEEVDPSGRSYSLGNEAKALFGIKVMAQDIERRLLGLGNKRKAVLNEATQFASSPFTSRGTQSDTDLYASVARMQDARRQTLAEMRKDFLAAQALGMDRATALSQLKQSSLSDEEVGMVAANIYKRHAFSKETLEKVVLAGRELKQDRLSIYRSALDAYPPTQTLLPSGE